MDPARSVNQIRINNQTEKLNVRVYDKITNTFVDGSIGLNRIQSANVTNALPDSSNSSNSTRNIIILMCFALICGFLVKTLVLDKRKMNEK